MKRQAVIADFRNDVVAEVAVAGYPHPKDCAGCYHCHPERPLRSRCNQKICYMAPSGVPAFFRPVSMYELVVSGSSRSRERATV